ncbi:MAG: hypothetical protein KatS3mg110_1681 [Pirellulaceae bacterium]|nr:MAG: hypothetical protein KatS3mg110_1681 [Pirellulaceae bacterium]
MVRSHDAGRPSRPRSVLEAVRLGIWDFDPEQQTPADFPATDALPGTIEKVMVLAQRLEQGLPLWHPKDRKAFDESAED